MRQICDLRVIIEAANVITYDTVRGRFRFNPFEPFRAGRLLLSLSASDQSSSAL